MRRTGGPGDGTGDREKARFESADAIRLRNMLPFQIASPLGEDGHRNYSTNPGVLQQGGSP